jgi:signal transduction histidine kinase
VRDAGASRLQGVVADWAELEKALLALVPDLFAAGRPSSCAAPRRGRASRRRCSRPCPRGSRRGPAAAARQHAADDGDPRDHVGHGVLALAILGFTLRAAIGYGERRARFASAVTHELRTPLTTFRMYSEMLADGVVKEPRPSASTSRRCARESDRLARVVENVLGWARLEEGRFATRRDAVGVGALCERVAAAAAAQGAGCRHGAVARPAAELRALRLVTDEDAVGQILFNLVDNAAKHARSAEDRASRSPCARAAGVCAWACATTARACPRSIARGSSCRSTAGPSDREQRRPRRRPRPRARARPRP